MKNTLLLCKTLIKRNSVFTFGILIMYVLSVALSFFAFSFTDSAKASVIDFCNSYGLPDAVYFTEPLDVSLKEKVKNIETICNVSDRFVYDISVLDEAGKIYYLRAFRYSDDEVMKNRILKSADIDDSKKGVFLSWGIAEHSSFDAGSKIIINAPSGQEELILEAIVANPETIRCQRDAFSICENFQFGHLYIPDTEFDRLFGTKGQANQWNVYFDGELSAQELASTEQELDTFFGNRIISKEYRENSEAINALMDVIDTANIICIVIPAFVFLVTLVFGCLFLSQIFDDQKQMIGILRSVGFSKSVVVHIFMFYVFLIVFASFVVGLPIGYLLLKLCLKAFIDGNKLGNAIFVIKTINIMIACVVVVLVASVTCLLVIKKILNIDPAQTTSGAKLGNDEVIEGLSKVNTKSFFKLSLSSILKNKGRFIAGTLCVTFCITFIASLTESVVSNSYPLKAVYRERFCYDYLIKANDDGTLEQALNEMDALDRTEPQIIFSAAISFSDGSQDVILHAIEDGSVLDAPRDIDDNIVYPQDGIVLDEMLSKEHGIQTGDIVYINGKEITVSAIAREYTQPIQYLSLNSAKELGFVNVNAFAVTLKNNADPNAVKSEINLISPRAVVISHDLQITDAEDGVALTEIVLNLFAVLTFLIGILIILNMTVIQLNERTFDYAVLRSLGASAMRISTVMLTEETIRALIGVMISYPLSYSLTNMIFSMISSKIQQFAPIYFNKIFLLSGAISIIFILASWIASVILIKKMDYLSIMNRND